jgi:C1A family cysteine protease
MSKLLVLAVLAVAVSALTRESEYQQQFTDFLQTYEKKYDGTEEFFYRFAVFKEKLDEINAHNAGNHTFTLGVNEFSDMPWAEFQATMMGFTKPAVDNSEEWASNAIPSNDIDWRTKGGVTGIKNQGSCGSCWAFAGVGSLETWNFVKGGSLVALSEQQVLDCSKGGSCQGGMPENSITWGCKGLCNQASYTYTARQGTCKTCSAVSAKCSSAKKLSSETAQAQALDTNAISIGVYIGSAFQSYKSGVFSGPCGSGGHAMVVVAYDSASWTVKNSWGSSWGEQGYSRWARGKNVCQFSGHSHVPS